MQIAHILRKYDPSEWGGTESVVLQLTADFSAHGVDSIVYAPRIPPDPDTADPFEAAGCAVRRFSACVPVWGISAEQRRQRVAVGGNLISLQLMALLWSERGIDVIHSHAQGRLGAIGRVVARAKGIPFVVSIHGGAYDLPAAVHDSNDGGWDWGKAVGFMLGARRLLDQADAIITFNSLEAALMREHHPGRRVLIEPHGISTAIFARDCRSAAIEAFPRLEGRSVLLIVGRIDPNKNQNWLIAETAELIRRHPKVLLVFVGACTNRAYGDALTARVESEGVQNSVLEAGSLPFGDSRLIGLFQLARAVLLPSIAETFGIVILEAWAAGTPVIASRTAGAVGLVEESVNGLLFDLDRPAGFHLAVDSILAHPDLAARWGAAGRAKVVSDFDTSTRASRMKRLYEELIEEKNALRHSS